METYTKIDTMYKRYAFDGRICPKKEWLKFRNKIILGEFSNKEAEYLFHNLWEAYSKIDGTNSKIAFYPSTQEIRVGGKTDNANSQHGQFEMLEKIGERIKPQLCAMFPKESAKFVPVKNGNKIELVNEDGVPVEPDSADMYNVYTEELPIYIYGEYFGTGIQKGGGRYIQNGNDFLVFDIKQRGWWLPKENRDAICKSLGLEQVPFLGHMTLEDIEKMVRGGFTTKFDKAADPTLLEEGIVARPIVPLYNGNGSSTRVIVKVKYCDYVEYDAVRKQFTDEEFTEFDTWYHENVENLYKK